MILDETLHHLRLQGALAARRITAIHLTPYFTVVGLDDGEVGACMSYYRLPAPVTEFLVSKLIRTVAEDPLLFASLWETTNPPGWDVPRDQLFALATAIKLATVSALSARCLRAGGDASFAVSRSTPADPFADVQRALVIGFGGYMDHLARSEQIKELHICDLFYDEQRDTMEARLAPYRQRFPDKRITLSNGRDAVRRLREVDGAAITGSALANGTMDGLLQEAGGHARIVVQGQSAAIHPTALFARGVQLVATTIKPLELIRLAAEDPTGEAMRPQLEGGLPVVYCEPRQH